jgi:hypothetical protein
VNQSLIGGDFDPMGLAIAGAYIYWSNPVSDTIGRPSLDGTRVNQTFITGASLPLGLAVGP